MIYLIRHGQTEWNKAGIFRGRKDLSLSEEGKRQALCTARRLKECSIAAVYSSPLKRAIETADAIASECRCPVIHEEGLIDLDFGDWEGRTFDWVQANDPEQYMLYKRSPQRCTIPGGESLKDCYDRAFRTFLRISAQRETTESGYAVVSHRVILKLILLGVFELPLSSFWKIVLDTCSVSEVERKNNEFIIRGMNSGIHLSNRPLHGIDF